MSDILINVKLEDNEVVNNIIKIQERIDELKQSQKELKAIQKDGTATEAQKKELIAVNTELGVLNKSMKLYQKELENSVKAENAEIGSLEQMRAELNNMLKDYDKLSQDKRNSPFGQDKQREIQELTAKIETLEHATGRYGRQVGNYEIAARPAKQALRELSMEIQNLSVRLTSANVEIQAQEAIVNQLKNTMGENSQEYINAKQRLDELNSSYQNAQGAMTQMEKEAGTLRDSINDANARIKIFADDNAKLGAMTQGVKALTSAYTILQTSMSLLGFSTEDLINVYAKLQMVQKSINGVMTIAKALNKDSNLMVMARLKLEKTRIAYQTAYNAALKTETATMAADTAATTVNTTAHWSLSAAIKGVTAAIAANPIGAILVAVTAAVTVIIALTKKWVKATNEQKEAQKQAAEDMKKSVETYRDSLKSNTSEIANMTKKYDEQISKIKTLDAITKSNTATLQQKRNAMAELNRLIPQYNGQMDESGRITKANTTAIDNYINKLKDKAKAEAQTQLLINAYLEQGDLLNQKRQAESDKKWYEERIKLNEEMFNAAQQMNDAETMANAQKNLDYYTKKLEMASKAIKGINVDLQAANKSVKMAEGNVSVFDGNSTNSTSKTTKNTAAPVKNEDVENARKTYEQILKDYDKYQSELIKINEDSAKTRTEIENARWTKEEQTYKVEISKLESILNATDKEGYTLIDEGEERDNMVKLLSDYQTIMDNARAVHDKNLDKITSDTAQAYNDIITKMDKSITQGNASEMELLHIKYQEQYDALQTEMDNELSLHEYTEEQKAVISAKYAEKRKQLNANETKDTKLLYLKNTQSILSALQNATSSLESMLSAAAEGNEKLVKYQKAAAMANIMVNAATSIAAAVSAGVQAGGFTGPAAMVTIPVFVAELVAIVGSTIASAISTLKKAEVTSAPRFATGGYVSGEKGVDKIPAWLTDGEYVIKRSKVQQYGVDFFDALNFKSTPNSNHYANGGQVRTIVNQSTNQLNLEQMAEIMANIQPIVSVKEITNTQNRVKIKEQISKA